MRRSMRLLSMAARAMLSICGDWQPAPAQRPWFALLCNDGFCGGRAARGRVAIKAHSTGRWTVRSFRNPAHRGTSFAQQALLACSGVNVWCLSQPVPTTR